MRLFIMFFLASALLTALALPQTPAASAVGDVDACTQLLASPPEAAGEALAMPLRVSTWNTMKFDREESPGMLASLASNSDLLLLQESLRDTAPATGYAHRLFAPGYANGIVQTGVETRSRVAADIACNLSFTEPWLRAPKAVSVGRFPLQDGTSLLVVNLHAINFTLGTDEYAAQLDAVATLLEAHGGAAIVAGDFNNWSEQRTTVLREFARKAGLDPVDISPDLRSQHFGVPVDGIFLRGLRSVTASAFPTDASDHHPLSAVLLPAPILSQAVASTDAPAPAPAAAQ